MSSKDIEHHLDKESCKTYKIIKAGRFWLLRTKGKTKRVSFLDNANDVFITENILVAGENIFEIDEDENGQISFQRVEDVSYNSKDVKPHSKEKVQDKQELKTKADYLDTNASSFDKSRSIKKFAVPIYDGTKEDLRMLPVNDICENKLERRPVGSGLINTKTEKENGKDAIEENEVPLETNVKCSSVSSEYLSDLDDDLERGHEEYVSLQRGSTDEDSIKEVKREKSASKKLEDVKDLSGKKLNPLTVVDLMKRDPSVQNAQKQLYQTFEPLSYQAGNREYIYLLCGTDEQRIILGLDDMFETKSDAIVIFVDSKATLGSTASILRSKMSRSASSEYMREVDLFLKNTTLGDVFLTKGYSSGYRYIIHVISQKSARNKPYLERQLDLRKMYEKIFEVCQGQNEIQSVAITLFWIDTWSKEEVKMGSRELLNAYINFFLKSGPRLEPMSVHLKCRREITFNTVKDVFDFYVTRKKAGHENASQRCPNADDTASSGESVNSGKIMHKTEEEIQLSREWIDDNYENTNVSSEPAQGKTKIKLPKKLIMYHYLWWTICKKKAKSVKERPFALTH